MAVTVTTTTKTTARRDAFHDFAVNGRVFRVDTFYKFVRAVGDGATSVVAGCVDTRTGTHVAIKRVRFWDPRRPDAARDVMLVVREIDFLRHLAPHPNIVPLHDVIEPRRHDGHPDVVYIVTPLMEETLYSFTGRLRLGPLLCKAILFQILRGLAHMHACGVTHRDLKPQNILVDHSKGTFTVRICDLGTARALHANGLMHGYDGQTDYVTTRWYRAPECILGGGYTERIDTWAVGCIMYELMNGGTPLFGVDTGENLIARCFRMMGMPPSATLDRICHANERPAVSHMKIPAGKGRDWTAGVRKDFGLDAEALLRGLLTIDPDARWTAAQALASPYFHDVRRKYAVALPAPVACQSRQRPFGGSEVSEQQAVMEARDTLWKAIVDARPDLWEAYIAWRWAWTFDRRTLWIPGYKPHTFDQLFLHACSAHSWYKGNSRMVWRVQLVAPENSVKGNTTWAFDLLSSPPRVPSWQNDLYKKYEFSMTNVACTDSQTDPNIDKWYRLRNDAYLACDALSNELVMRYEDAIGASPLLGIIGRNLITLIARYANDVPFNIKESMPVLCARDSQHAAKRQRIA